MDNNIELIPPKLSKEEIRITAYRLLGQYRDAVSQDFQNLHAIEFFHFYKAVIAPIFGTVIVEDVDLPPTSDGIQRLGTYEIAANRAIIALPVCDPRRTWTLWHEVVGHGVLHGPYFRHILDEASRGGAIDVTAISISDQSRLEIERQANYLAASVAAPLDLVTYWVRRIFGIRKQDRPIRYTGAQSYTLSVNGKTLPFDISSHHDICRVVASKIRTFFGGMSVESLAYRVAETGLVQNRSASAFQNHHKQGNLNNLKLDRIAI